MATKRSKNQAAKKKSAPRSIFIIDRSNVLGWIFAAFLGCGLMFVLGVLVGRNQAPIHFDLQRLDEKLANLKQSVLTTKMKPVDVIGNLKKDGLPEVQDRDPRTVAPRYAKKDITKESVSPEALKPKPVNPKAETNPAEPEAEKPAADEAASTSSQAETSAPAPDTASDPPPVKKPADTEQRNRPSGETVSAGHGGVDGYAIQIASMQDPENAALVRDRFLAKGYPAYCRKADINDKTWHRVRIGPYPSKDKARKDLKNLTDAGVSAMIFLNEGANP